MSKGKQILLCNQLRALRGQFFLSLLLIVKLTCTAPFFRKLYRQWLRSLVKKTGLFDPEYYLSANGDVAQKLKSPLLHYVSYGDREGRMPLPVFEPAYYRKHCPSKLNKINTLLHYVYVGRYLKVSPSPWIDIEYYLANNKDIARSGMDPLLHYLNFGGLEGRSPSTQFAGDYYLRNNPDVLQSRVNPLLHYIRFGRHEGRPSQPAKPDEGNGLESSEPAEGASLPVEPDWSLFCSYADVPGATVDVIVPVYKGRAETLRCIYSLLSATCKIDFELIVINDASPDVDLAADLERLAERGYFSLHINSENAGFVDTVNSGMELHPKRDVVILNSDTEVFGDWLDRLRGVALSDEMIGTVTPLSNNATICSYPISLHDNPYPLELDYSELDSLTAKVNAGFKVEAPTGVGFCMYIKRSCLIEIGQFDAKLFGTGYGEENDFCQRAISRGWKNIIAPEVFIRHWGSASFQGQKEKRVQNALKILGKKYPNYDRDVRQFITRDPLALARGRLDKQRLHRHKGVENVLIVTHNRGGGAERHVQEDTRALLSQGKGVFFLRPQKKAPDFVVLSHPVVKLLPNLPAFQLADTEGLATFLKDLSISEVHTHGLVDFEMNAPSYLIRLVKQLDLHFEVNIHDYKVICPRINLVDDQGYYCGEPSAVQCNSCLKTYGSDFGARSIEAWRSIHNRALGAADRVLVPDEDVASRLLRYYPDVHFEVSPHEQIDPTQLQIHAKKVKQSENLRIVVIGAIGDIKGFGVLLSCARDILTRRLPIELIVMGYTKNDQLLKEAGVRITGRYLEENGLETLLAQSPHIAWLPSLWPETYSYTLSLAQRASLPVVAFDIGAIARRIREYDINASDHLLSLSWAKRPGRINDQFVELRSSYLESN